MRIAFEEQALCECCRTPLINRRSNAKYCSDVCGNRVRVARFTPSGEAQQRKLELQTARRKTPAGQYQAHKASANQRGIAFTLSYDEWWAYWKDHWIPNKHGKLCMCRTNDSGGYSVGNVRIDTWANNIREARGLPLE